MNPSFLTALCIKIGILYAREGVCESKGKKIYKKAIKVNFLWNPILVKNIKGKLCIQFYLFLLKSKT